MKQFMFVALAAVLVLVTGAAGLAGASGTSQSFNVLNAQTQPGMLMSLTANSNVAEPASDKNAAQLYGIVSSSNTDITQQPGQVSIQNDGTANALVSTLDGDVRVGDKIATSSLVGVGAKAVKSGWVVGVAQASLDSTTKGAIKTMVTDSKNVKHIVYVGTIPVVAKVMYYTSPNDQAKKTTPVPSNVQSAAESIAGKKVSTVILVVSGLLMIVGVIFAGVVISTAIKNGFAAVARQPLAKRVIFRRVLQSFGMAALIMVFVSVGSFVLLKYL